MSRGGATPGRRRAWTWGGRQSRETAALVARLLILALLAGLLVDLGAIALAIAFTA